MISTRTSVCEGASEDRGRDGTIPDGPPARITALAFLAERHLATLVTDTAE